MESSEEKVEMIKKAITEMMEEEENGNTASHRRHQLLNKLLSELEQGKEEVDDSSGNEEEVMKELKKVKRQNSITHYLLTAMIVITLGWQLSEVSFILKIKHGITNPFKSATEMVKGFLLKGRGVGGHHVMKAASDVQKQLTQPAYLNIPSLDFYSTATDEDDDFSFTNN